MAAAGVLGGLGMMAGSQPDEVKQRHDSGVSLGSQSGVDSWLGGTEAKDSYVAVPGGLNKVHTDGTPGAIEGWMKQIAGMVDKGPGASDVEASTATTRDYAKLLKQYGTQGGNDPTQQDINGASGLADKLFAGQRTAMNQGFDDQRTEFARRAALMGRGSNDPILAAKLAQEQTRQSSLLDANQGSWSTQYAMQQPMQRLGFLGQRADVMSGLASQAMNNRTALLNMGTSMLNNERSWRYQTANKWGTSTQESGGGFKGAMNGLIAGFGAGAGTGGMGGGQTSSPAAPQMTMASPQAASYFQGPPPQMQMPQQQSMFSQPSYAPNYGSSFNGQPRNFNLGMGRY